MNLSHLSSPLPPEIPPLRYPACARAFLRGLGKRGLDCEGDISFYKESYGGPTLIVGYLRGLSPGLHGLHVYEFGDCTEGARSAGAGADAGISGAGRLSGHWNPTGKKHGSLESQERHIGDLGNIVAQSNGVAAFHLVADSSAGLEFEGEFSLIGRAVIVHEGIDDLGATQSRESQETGCCGKEAACGTIGWACRDYVEEATGVRLAFPAGLKMSLAQTAAAPLEVKAPEKLNSQLETSQEPKVKFEERPAESKTEPERSIEPPISPAPAAPAGPQIQNEFSHNEPILEPIQTQETAEAPLTRQQALAQEISQPQSPEKGPMSEGLPESEIEEDLHRFTQSRPLKEISSPQEHRLRQQEFEPKVVESERVAPEAQTKQEEFCRERPETGEFLQTARSCEEPQKEFDLPRESWKREPTESEHLARKEFIDSPETEARYEASEPSRRPSSGIFSSVMGALKSATQEVESAIRGRNPTESTGTRQ